MQFQFVQAKHSKQHYSFHKYQVQADFEEVKEKGGGYQEI